MQIRLVPIVIFAATTLLTVKLGDVWRDAGSVLAQNRAAAAQPTPPAAPPAAPDAPPAAAKPVERAGRPNQVNELSEPEVTAKPKRNVSYSPAELDLLQSLSERRATLDHQAEEQNRRETLLRAAEQRVDEKIAKLETIQRTIDGLLKKYDEQEEAKIRGLVHIYETMKPKEAARIFEQLDMPVLLEVVERMKDVKTAALLASMEPDKARTITIALAERRQLPTVKP